MVAHSGSGQEKSLRLSRRRLFGWFAVASTLAGGSRMASAGPAFRDLPKAMWVWEDRILNPEGLEAFAQAHNIGTLFLYTTPTAAEALLGGVHSARQVVAALKSQRRRIYAMAGEPDWALGPSVLPEHLALLIRLQRLSMPLFDGIHLDVEPNAVEDWNEHGGKARLIEGTIAFYDLARAHASGISIDAAVNPIFASLRTTGGDNFLTALARRVNSVSIMAYRNRVQATLAWASPAIRALTADKPWRLGVQVDPNDPEPNTSWDRQSRADFEAAMVELDRQLRLQFQSSSYAGLVFQGFDGLRTLLQT